MQFLIENKLEPPFLEVFGLWGFTCCFSTERYTYANVRSEESEQEVSH